MTILYVSDCPDIDGDFVFCFSFRIGLSSPWKTSGKVFVSHPWLSQKGYRLDGCEDMQWKTENAELVYDV